MLVSNRPWGSIRNQRSSSVANLWQFWPKIFQNTGFSRDFQDFFRILLKSSKIPPRFSSVGQRWELVQLKKVFQEKRSSSHHCQDGWVNPIQWWKLRLNIAEEIEDITAGGGRENLFNLIVKKLEIVKEENLSFMILFILISSGSLQLSQLLLLLLQGRTILLVSFIFSLSWSHSALTSEGVLPFIREGNLENFRGDCTMGWRHNDSLFV
jgi:hypothetical protein